MGTRCQKVLKNRRVGREMAASGELKILGGVYAHATGKVKVMLV
jgi:hypothetical protein